MKKPALVWDEWNREHIKKHNVTEKEVEEAYEKSDIEAEAKYGRKFVLSKISNGRLITIFLSFKKQAEPYLVSARDASNKERRIYYEKYEKKL